MSRLLNAEKLGNKVCSYRKIIAFLFIRKPHNLYYVKLRKYFMLSGFLHDRLTALASIVFGHGRYRIPNKLADITFALAPWRNQ